MTAVAASKMPTFCDQSIAELEIYVASEFAKPLKYIWHDLLHRLGVVPLERSTTVPLKVDSIE